MLNSLAALPILLNLLIVDAETKEPLTGVRVQTNNHIYYSDFDGNVNLPNDEKILNIDYVSYKPVSNISLENDTTIQLDSK